MKTVLLGLVMAAGTLPAHAQSQGQASTATMPAGIIGSGAPAWSGTSSYGHVDPLIRSSLDTPTMRRQKMAWAVALRDEALALQARDGGTLSDRHVREIERKSSAIRSHSHAGPGALAPIRD